VHIKNIEVSRGGDLLIAIYDEVTKNEFPLSNRIYVNNKVKVEGNETTVKYRLPEGIYAIAVLHDENGNEEMDFNWFGYPQEGFAFSRNPSIIVREPGFEECDFSLKRDTTIVIKMIYK
jgi:uncharacterized protein (DUF2141 family)